MSGSQKSHRILLLAISLMLLLAALDQTIVSTALPTIVSDLGGLDQLSWVVTAYILASTVSAPLYGKLGDLYGRKIVMQVAVIIFLLGSVLAGISTSMNFLIGARAIQGLGGGGLFVLAFTVVGDLVAPRERGKIQGILGGVFGLASIAGPLIGGYLVDQLSWNWIFYVNVPMGLLALGIFAVAFKPAGKRVRHVVDYTGALFLAISLACLVLYTSFGGRTHELTDLPMLALLGTSIISAVIFVFVETRAKEPILPLMLFSTNTFTVMVGIVMVIGAAMFGGMTFLPLFLQTVKGLSPTESGLNLLPMMFGILGGSIVSGQIMSRTGHYKWLPTIGAVVMAFGLYRLSSISPDRSSLVLSIDIFILGLGMGPIMSVGTTAIQNAVPREIMGAATASYTMFRQIGGSVGVALFGTLFTSGLQSRLPADHVPVESLSFQTISDLPEEFQNIVMVGITDSLQPIFMVAAVMSVGAVLISLLLEEVPLETRVKTGQES